MKVVSNSSPLIFLSVIGTLGFLKVMQRKGMVKNLKSVLDALQNQGFWMDTELYRKMLED
jgi:predicted nucleic acid-binding protein